jgi:O-antigen ligase
MFTAAALVRGRARVLTLLGLPVLFAAAILVAPMAKERLIRGIDVVQTEAQLDHPTSMGIRIELWRITAGLIADKPWLGYGTGAFPGEYAKRAAATRTGWRADPKSSTHNQYMSVQVQAGLLGSAAFAIFLLSALWQPAPLPFRIGAVAILIGWTMVSLFFSAFEDFTEGHMIAILLGCLLARETDRLPGGARAVSVETS